MKAVCDKNKIKEAIMIVEKGVGKNTSLPVLSQILIEADEKNLIFKSTNLETGIEISIPAKVERVGNIAISGNIISSLLQNISREEKIEIEAVSGNLKIKTKGENMIIRGVDSEDFPTIPRIKEGKTIKIEGAQLLLGLKSVAYAAATSEIKPEISSVYLYQNDGFLTFVSTDSFRLAEKKIKIENRDQGLELIIPFRATTEIIRVFERSEEDLLVKSDKNQISIQSGGTYFTSRLINGTFPDYKQIIPKDFKTEVTILKSDLSEKLKIAAIFSDKFSQVDLKIFPKNKSFEIVSQNQDVGEGETSVEAVLEGDDLEAGFNAKYILDSLQSFSGDSVVLKLNEKNKPLLIRGVGDESFQYLVMPLYR